MLPALGFALLMQLTYNKELAPYLFIGFVIVAFLGMSNVGVAIVGAILAVLVFNSAIMQIRRWLSMTTKSNEEATGKKNNEKGSYVFVFSALFFFRPVIPWTVCRHRALPIPLSLYLKSCMGIIRKNYRRL